ncbi:sigma-70 family RNA polymerase sigma factor [Bacillus sp. ISL-75]|uniref:sigma factor-like helix-turn-helix DNA-binding protein n=1 Tax=Bacillus sp. ISL-75 TaxID=2819137 RepID=UPI001BE5C10B|nr:sigma factor-like helix-turn-helix DNA-binding protein [Bacillus sp. ISL-75]MBT2728377.1 sigma-70 family RNA polymerase sigma factor [Bacillus sp. ISL-75]
MMFNSKASGKTAERILENHLRLYKTYQVGIKNCEQQLEYIMPSLVANYGVADNGSFWFIANNTENVALDRIESKRAIDLREQIECYKITTSSIENAVEELKMIERAFVQLRYFEGLTIQEVKGKLGYSEERSIYRIRRNVLDKLMISLNNLLSFK